jgi:hypothetical protein
MNPILERPHTVAINHDAPLRYLVPSNRNPQDKHLVELDAYKGNGRCDCEHFTMRCEPLVRRRVSPFEAVGKGLIKLKVNRHVQDALRCEHILTARAQFVDDVLAAIAERRPTEEKRKEAWHDS